MQASSKEFIISTLVVLVTVSLLVKPVPIITTVYFIFLSGLLIYIGIKAIRTKRTKIWLGIIRGNRTKEGSEAAYYGYLYTIGGIVLLLATLFISEII